MPWTRHSLLDVRHTQYERYGDETDITNKHVVVSELSLRYSYSILLLANPGDRIYPPFTARPAGTSPDTNTNTIIS